MIRRLAAYELAVATALIGLSDWDKIDVLDYVREVARRHATTRKPRGTAMAKRDKPIACSGCGNLVTRHHRGNCPRAEHLAKCERQLPLRTDEHGRIRD